MNYNWSSKTFVKSFYPTDSSVFDSFQSQVATVNFPDSLVGQMVEPSWSRSDTNPFHGRLVWNHPPGKLNPQRRAGKPPQECRHIGNYR